MSNIELLIGQSSTEAERKVKKSCLVQPMTGCFCF